MKKNILNELGKRIVFFDGGMGTLLQERGLEAGELPENWNLKHPDIIRELHRDYLNAGADIILANTFGANELKFPDTLWYPFPELLWIWGFCGALPIPLTALCPFPT